MATTSEIQDFYNRLLELKDSGYDIDYDESGHKNYTSYWIGKKNGNAEYKDCVIIYNGNKGEENQCLPDEIPAKDLLEEVNSIVSKIDSVFN